MAINKTKDRPLYSAVDEVARNNVATHEARTDNPHSVTVEQVGARPDTWTPTAEDTGAIPSLDSRLVSAMDFKGEHPRFFGVKPQTSGQYSDGSGTCFSDGNGMQGVIEQGENMYIGEGYENLFTESQINGDEWISGDGTDVVIKTDFGGYYELEGTTSTSSTAWARMETPSLLVAEQGKITIEVENIGTNDVSLTARDNGLYYISVGEKLRLFYDVTAPSGLQRLNFSGLASNEQLKVRIKKTMIYSQTSQQVPFVPDTAPDGRLVIEQPWTSATHSFIFAGFKPSETSLFFKLSTPNGDQSSKESIYLTAADPSKIYDCVFSDSYNKAYRDDGAILTTTVDSKGISGDYVNFGRNLIYSGRAELVGSVFIYEGQLTEQELRDELAKIKSENFVLPDDGMTDAIPYSVVQRDDSGKIETATQSWKIVGTPTAINLNNYEGTVFSVQATARSSHASYGIRSTPFSTVIVKDVTEDFRVVLGGADWAYDAPIVWTKSNNTLTTPLVTSVSSNYFIDPTITKIF